MQTTRDKHETHSPRKDSQKNNGNNKSESVAQLVMSMNTADKPNEMNTNNKSTNSGANSIESDREVEEITNRASRVDLNQGTSKINSSNDQNNNNNNNNNNNKNNNNNRLSETVAVNVNAIAATSGPMLSSSLASTTITTTITNNQLANSGTSIASATTNSGNGSCSASSSSTTSSSGCNNNNNNNNNINTTGQLPITVGGSGGGGVTNGGQSNGSGLGAVKSTLTIATTANKQVSSTATAAAIAREQQKLSITVPTNFGQLTAQGSSNFPTLAMTANNKNKLQPTTTTTTTATTLDACSREYCNDDFDDYDTRYDTAAMEDSTTLVTSDNNHQQQQQQQQCNGGDTNSSDNNFEQQHQHEENNYSSGNSQPSSPKAKSAPATPCNVTPTAFHQHNSQNKSNLPNPANTLPVDTRRNISATCRMLPSSISLAHHSHQMAHNHHNLHNPRTHHHHHQHQQQHQQQQLQQQQLQQQQQQNSHTFTTTAATTTTIAALGVGVGIGSAVAALTNNNDNSNSSNINNNINNNNSNNNNGHQQLAQAVSDQYLDNLIEEGEILFERGSNYSGAIRNFTQCIELATQNGHFDYLKKNFRVYSQRAESYFKLHQYSQAIEDSMAARELNPKKPEAHYILGKAQFHLDKHVDSLTAFSFGLAQNPTYTPLFDALVSAALNSSYPKLDDFKENYKKLSERDLDKDQFVVVATLGQELLSKNHYPNAAIVLESALKLGTDNKRFKSSTLSTLSYVFCALNNFKKALAYMRLELEIEQELNDVEGQCRVLSNIGYSYYKMGKFVKSLQAQRQRLNLAIQNSLYQQTAQAFNATGHVHVARNDFANALTSHERCLIMLKRLGENEFEQFKELLAIGHVNSLLADFKTSEEKYKEAIQMLDSSNGGGSGGLRKEERQIGSIMVHFNLAYLALKRQSFMEATRHYESVIDIASSMESGQKRLLYEIRALNGLGHTCRVFQRFDEARNYFAKQVELAKKINDRSSLSQAMCNLGMIYQHFKNYNTAWSLFDENMQLVEDDPLLRAYAHSYRGSMHFLWGDYTKAHEEYEKSLNIFKDFEHCSAEMKTIELNMDAVSERLGRSQISLASNTARVQRKVVMA